MEPDGTVAKKKRFWRGNFLFATERELGGPGWKRFRPLVRRGEALVRLDDASLAKHPEYGDVKREALARSRGVLRPHGRGALARAAQSGARAARDRRRARGAGADPRDLRGERPDVVAAAKGGPPAPCPTAPPSSRRRARGRASTPSRNLRLLIAIDVAKNLPARVERRPTRYAMPEGVSPAGVRAALEQRLARELVARRVAYTRTDGSAFTLTLAEVAARGAALGAGLRPERLRGDPLGRAGRKRGGAHLPGAGAGGAARPHGAVPRLVLRTETPAPQVAVAGAPGTA